MILWREGTGQQPIGYRITTPDNVIYWDCAMSLTCSLESGNDDHSATVALTI